MVRGRNLNWPKIRSKHQLKRCRLVFQFSKPNTIHRIHLAIILIKRHQQAVAVTLLTYRIIYNQQLKYNNWLKGWKPSSISSCMKTQFLPFIWRESKSMTIYWVLYLLISINVNNFLKLNKTDKYLNTQKYGSSFLNSF